VMLSRPLRAAARPFAQLPLRKPLAAGSVMPRREASLTFWSNPQTHALIMHVTAQDVPKQWVSPTAERVWHRMKRLKETEFRLWAEEEAAKARSPWRRWGIYPLVGLGLSAMISKEFGILLLGEYQYIPIFIAAVTGVYVYGRGGLEDWFKSAHAKKRSQDTEVFDWKIELAQEALAEHRANARIIDLVHEYEAEHMAARKEMQNYWVVKPKHEWRAATIRKLEAIKAKELAEDQELAKKIFSGANKFVLDKIAGDSGLRSGMVSDAIDRVGAPAPIAPSDPILKIFNEYLGTYKKGPLKLESSSGSGSRSGGTQR